MKKLFFLFLMVITTSSLLAQAPNAFKYQAVLRGPEGQAKVNQEVTLDIGILQGSPMGTLVYSETHKESTNLIGLVNVEIGMGTSNDNFNSIDWKKGPYFLKILVDGTEFGTSQLLSVPYALYADQAGNTFSGNYNDLSNTPTETDPVYSASEASGILNSGSGEVITVAERNKLNDAITINGAVQQGNLLSFDNNNWVAKDLVTGNTGLNSPVNNLQPYQAISFIIALQGIYPSRSGIEPFIGEIAMFGGNFAPRGWAYCNGQLLAISNNDALFSLLGTIYGGDGRTTFALPDLRGRVPMHWGNGPGLSDYRIGQKSGSETTTLNVLQLPAHNHTVKGN